MKIFKTEHKKNFNLVLVIFFVTSIFCACGLDTFYNLQPPVSKVHEPTYSTASPTDKYFQFNTNDSANKNLSLSGFNYLGTAVYYRIYQNYSAMISKNESIQSVNNDTNYNAAAERLISYGYQELNCVPDADSPLIKPGAGNSVSVRIRLTDYNEYKSPNPDRIYLPHIYVDGNEIGVPRRQEGKYSFDFGRVSDEPTLVKIPSSSDSDFESGSFSSGYDNTYFVDLYAVAVGRDTTYTTYYSNVLHLGAVSINASSKTN